MRYLRSPRFCLPLLLLACSQQGPQLRPVVTAQLAAAEALAQTHAPGEAACAAQAAELELVLMDATQPWSVRSAQMDALAQLPCDAAARALVRLVEQGEGDVQRRALLCIAESGHDQALTSLLDMSSRAEDNQTKWAFALAMAAHGNYAGVPAASTEWNDGAFEAGCRAGIEDLAQLPFDEIAAAWRSTAALTRLVPPPASAHLRLAWWRTIQDLSHADEHVRLRALNVLSHSDSRVAIPLAEAAWDTDPRVQDGALQALRNLGARAEPAVYALLGLLDVPSTRVAALQALAHCCDPRARRDLQTRRNELGDDHSTPDEAAWAAQLDAAIAQLVAAGA
ncbi:MAG: hypothetical protein RIT40_1178 [Planctomycetota bacterium]|jgi:HEAT repeat protein